MVRIPVRLDSHTADCFAGRKEVRQVVSVDNTSVSVAARRMVDPFPTEKLEAYSRVLYWAIVDCSEDNTNPDFVHEDRLVADT